MDEWKKTIREFLFEDLDTDELVEFMIDILPSIIKEGTDSKLSIKTFLDAEFIDEEVKNLQEIYDNYEGENVIKTLQILKAREFDFDSSEPPFIYLINKEKDISITIETTDGETVDSMIVGRIFETRLKVLKRILQNEAKN